MKNGIRTFIFGVLLSCTSISPVYNTVTHDEFNPYLQDFSKIVDNKKIQSRMDRTVILFGNLNSDPNSEKRTLGICYRTFHRSTIVIDTQYWKTASPTGRAFTMYHELGHCVCNLEHTEITDSWFKPFQEFFVKIGLIKIKPRLADGCPASIMHPYDMGEFCMLNNYMYYINELKESCNAN